VSAPRELEAARDRVLAGAALREGDDVLDLRAGSGLLTFGAHRQIGDGWVFAVDSSVSALEELLRVAHETNAAGVMYLVGDADVIPLPDAAVDVCVAQSEVARVLRPGGRISAHEPLDAPGADIAAVAQGIALAGETSQLAALGREGLSTAFAAAGFEQVSVEVETVAEPWTVDEQSLARRLDARDAAGGPSLRERWRESLGEPDLEALVAHLNGLAGETLTLRRAEAWLTARLP
jgi:SAM-dependent methyltransferase